ncbi:DUF6639 family protein [Ostreiculturibacter nitratireducens]|uniref:DUF6639 family protein n=1 Tax=Ostreiculturibacter nitratireducens TaxID=3075226 RepID=UPI0031B5B396
MRAFLDLAAPVPRWLLAVLATSCCISLEPHRGAADPLACPNPLISVETDDPELTPGVCAIAEAARPQLAQCGLVQTVPLVIEVVRKPAILIGGDVACLGTYDCERTRITLIHPDTIEEALGPDNPFAVIPRADLFASLVVHELSHALVDQKPEVTQLNRAAQEYVAYAMQLEAMPPAVRQRLLDAIPSSGPVELVELNVVLALGAPQVFSVKAWRHFSTPGNGCDFVEKLLSGEVSLVLDPI